MASAQNNKACDSVGAQRFIAIIATLLLPGCACSDADWDAAVGSRAEASGAMSEPDCDGEPLAQFSKATSSLMGRADPLMLEIARLEAERDCFKAAGRRARLGPKPSG